MATQRVERRLAAILAADIVGYSRLVERDEAGTLAAIRSLRERAVDPLLAAHRGRIAKLMGDGAIVEFGSVVDAVAFAVAMQEAVAEEQRATPADRRIRFRIGINLGDVVVDGDDLLGHGVNVAARLEQLCEPGGVLVSGTAFDQLQGVLPGRLAALGERRLKNIERPVRLYAVAPAAEGPRGGPGAAQAVPVPLGQPSIVVLPFANLSGDAAQQSLADGITEDIICDLGRFRDLDVIASHSSFAQRDSGDDPGRIGRELGVRFALTGSLQRAGGRVRVSARLADLSSGGCVWSERWERSAADVFVVQTEIAERTANSLAGDGVVLHAAAAAARRRRPDDLSAYERYLIGRSHLSRFTPDDAEQALGHYLAAVAQDPNLARAWTGMAASQSQLAGFSETPEPWDRRSLESARRAVELDPMDADACATLGEGLGWTGEFAEAAAALERAVTLNPSSADVLARYAGWAPRFGLPERGAAAADRARLLNPSWPVWYCMYLCRAYFFAGRHAEALAMVERKPASSIHLQDMVYAAASAAMLGDAERSRRWRERAMAAAPQLTAEWHLRAGGTAIADQTARRTLVEAMVRAGFTLCATAEQVARLGERERLPECAAERAKRSTAR
ncbi:MAG: adenylate/guanylate cyclase domain-containing protein [Geminicoccaceae bacterium]